jgi:c-di-GMP-binding flagellar brake protein YcgR
MSGASLKGRKRFDMGHQYAFRFKHKDRVVSVKGLIVWEKISGIEKTGEGETTPIYTAGISFSDVSAATSSQIREFISDHVNLLRDRMLSGIRINMQGVKGILSSSEMCTVRDISIGGIRIELQNKPSLDEVYHLELILAEDEDPVLCKGRIVFYHEKTERTARGYSAGVEFVNIESKTRLERFVDTLPADKKITREGPD